LRRIPDTVTFMYEGKEIEATLMTNFYNGEERGKDLLFKFKEELINISLEEEENYWHVAPLHYAILDKLGVKGHKKYERTLSDLRGIEKEYVVINNKVYKPSIVCLDISPKYYIVTLELENDTVLDGTYEFMTHAQRGNKKLLLDNLKSQAKNAYKLKSVEPSKKHLEETKTNEYQDKKKWIKELLESLN